MSSSLRLFYCLGILSLFSGCANIIPPTGGKTDTTPPKLLSIKPADSLRNTRVTRIDLRFNEYVVLTDVSKELHISPMLSQVPVMTVSGRTVSVKIPDSLLQDQTTYTVDFGKSIRDLHEGNAYTGKPFRFSTGPWFDSLQLSGTVMNAETGRIDSSGTVKILLYPARQPFDVIVREKPEYVANAGADGKFIVGGLPDKPFRIFALKESGDNLKFDNDDEWVGFADTTFRPSSDTGGIRLLVFKEIPDSVKRKADTGAAPRKPRLGMKTDVKASLDPKTFTYAANIDTGVIEKRTFDITKPVEILLSRKADTVNEQRIFLTADSNGVETESAFSLRKDSTGKILLVNAAWRQNTVYTLRLLKGFATDTGKNELMPTKYIFRTRSDEDYGKIEIDVPKRYVRTPYLLSVSKGQDSIYLQPLTQEKIQLNLLSPGDYTVMIIEDTDGNGEWTTGDLSKRRQPEKVIPYNGTVFIKAGWEHRIDFEPKKK